MVFSKSTTRLLRSLVLASAILAAIPAHAANVCDQTTGANCANVDAPDGALNVMFGKNVTDSYNLSTSAAAITASTAVLSLEAEASRGFRITQICIAPGQATAAAWTQWQLIRTTTASSAGTVISPEVTTGNNSLAKMDPADANWSGLARLSGTAGTSGAILDTGAVFVNVAATPPAADGGSCRNYCQTGEACPRVLAGTTNGVKLQFVGTAGGAGAAFSMQFIAE